MTNAFASITFRLVPPDRCSTEWSALSQSSNNDSHLPTCEDANREGMPV